MRPVLGHEEKSQDREKGAENESAESIHRKSLRSQTDDRPMQPLLHIGVRRVLLHHAVRVEEGRVKRNCLPHDLTPVTGQIINDIGLLGPLPCQIIVFCGQILSLVRSLPQGFRNSLAMSDVFSPGASPGGLAWMSFIEFGYGIPIIRFGFELLSLLGIVTLQSLMIAFANHGLKGLRSENWHCNQETENQKCANPFKL